MEPEQIISNFLESPSEGGAYTDERLAMLLAHAEDGKIMAHTCHAIGCERYVPPQMLMCRQHWWSVPAVLRNRVWSTYRDGQCDTFDPSSAYCQAAKAAVIAAAQKEGRTIDPRDPKILLYDMIQVSDEVRA